MVHEITHAYVSGEKGYVKTLFDGKVTAITDVDGNTSTLYKWFDSEELARDALETLQNCIGCLDCSYCVGCQECVDCNYCADCKGAIKKVNVHNIQRDPIVVSEIVLDRYLEEAQ